MRETSLVAEKPGSLAITPTEWTLMREQAAILIPTGFLPKSVNTPEKVLAIMMKGRELDVPPMQALSQIHIIEGKPSASSELMLALILKKFPTTLIHYLQNDELACLIEVVRPGHKAQRFSFSIEDAKNAGLANKSNWKSYTRAMLRSRCVAEMARALFPDAIAGMSYTPEELGADVSISDMGEEVVNIEGPSNTPRTAFDEEPEEKSVVSEVHEAKERKLTIARMLMAFAQLGVTKQMLDAERLNSSVEDASQAEIEDLRYLYDELKSGRMKIQDVFKTKAKPTLSERVKEAN